MLLGAAKLRPAQFYDFDWFYWDPDYLVQGGLKCPVQNCGAKLHRHGFTRPRRVIGLEKPFFMIGQRHRCPGCSTTGHSVTINSWDSRILNALPYVLRVEFPARMSHRRAISDIAFSLMRNCLGYGMGTKQFSNILRVLGHRHFDMAHAQYLDGLLLQEKQLLDPPLTKYDMFGTFIDRSGYAGFVPSSKWLCMMYDQFIEENGDQIDQKTAMCSGEVCCLDHHHKVKFILNRNTKVSD